MPTPTATATNISTRRIFTNMVLPYLPIPKRRSCPPLATTKGAHGFRGFRGKKIATGEIRVLSVSKLKLWGMLASPLLGRLVGAHCCALMGNRNAATLRGLVGAHQGALVHGEVFLFSPAGTHHGAGALVAPAACAPPQGGFALFPCLLHGGHFTTQKQRQPAKTPVAPRRGGATEGPPRRTKNPFCSLPLQITVIFLLIVRYTDTCLPTPFGSARDTRDPAECNPSAKGKIWKGLI